MEKVFGLNLYLEHALLRIRIQEYICQENQLKLKEEKEFSIEDNLDSLLQVVIRQKGKTLLIDCEPGTLRYGCRIINSIHAVCEKVRFAIKTNELEENQMYRIADVCFAAIREFDEFYKTMSEKNKQEVKTLYFHDLYAVQDEIYREIMDNGFVLFNTGAYPGTSGNFNNSIKHARIDDIADTNILKNLNMSINSAIYICGRPYCPEIFEKLMCVPGLLSHFHFIDDTGNAEFDDSGIRTEYIFMPYYEYVNEDHHKSTSRQKYILRLQTDSDHSAFQKVLNEFDNEGMIRNPMFYIEDECKLLENCKECRKQRYKPECNTVENTCDYIQKYEKTDFFAKRNLLQFLLLKGNIIKHAKAITVPNHRFSIFFKNIDNSSGSSNHDLLLLDGQSYYFDRHNMNLLRIDPKLFLIIEGDMRGAEDHEIVEALTEYCEIDRSTAEKVYQQGTRYLWEHNILFRADCMRGDGMYEWN